VNERPARSDAKTDGIGVHVIRAHPKSL